MTGIGAIVKLVDRWVDGIVMESVRDLRRMLAGNHPKPCPIPVREGAESPRRRRISHTR